MKVYGIFYELMGVRKLDKLFVSKDDAEIYRNETYRPVHEGILEELELIEP